MSPSRQCSTELPLQFSTEHAIQFLSKELPEPLNTKLMEHVLGRKLKVVDLILRRADVEQSIVNRYPDLRRALFPSTFIDQSMRERWVKARIRQHGYFLWLTPVPK